MSSPLTAVTGGKAPADGVTTGSKDGLDLLSRRRSKELVIGLSGPVGAGIPDVREGLEGLLRARGYEPVHVKVSELFEAQAARMELVRDPLEIGSALYNKIWGMQSLGNRLRAKLGNDMGAQLAIQAIAIKRTSDTHPSDDVGDIEPKRTAYLVDQLKHPGEVKLLKAIYGDMFFMIGVLSSHNRRKQFLTDQGMTTLEAEKVIDRDRKESDEQGQQLDKTLQHADFFVSKSKKNFSELQGALTRFLGLIHGDPSFTPNSHERGMFAAHSAGLRSACLSRQVGASIVDQAGVVISTGCNDVPKAGGGLYEPGPNDMRCVVRDRYCHNDKHKDQLRDQIIEVLTNQGLTREVSTKAADAIRSKTRVKDLIEFSKAVHAEMDAIIGIARSGVTGLQGSTLFTTVYPCHSCARHIVAAGITSVVYIEPYEKSLAISLHDDAIVQDPESEPAIGTAPSVRFIHFEGVSPQKFARLFQSNMPRKDDRGKVIAHDPIGEMKDSEFIDDYMELEARIVLKLEEFDQAAGPGGAAA